MAADETGTLTSLKALRREIFEPKTAEHSGRVVKLMGDGTLMEFGSVVDAITFAVEVQRTMAERNAGVPEDRRIAYRIGINIGDIIVEGEDIYVDGVNVAARLEALAEPGSICVSQPVHAQIKGKVELAFEDLGEQQVKNIPEPVQVFQVLLDQAPRPQPAAPTGTRQRLPAISAGLVLSLAAVVALVWWASREPQIEPASPEAMAFPLPDKPSLAVLPFNNMSDDASQEYFADGMTEDLITDLSKISGLFVIARNSSFSYKSQKVEVRQVAEELGVRYVLEGSVRRAGDEVRINAQLIDATTGGHLWAERYDGTLADVFDLQDQVTANIVEALALQLTPQEVRTVGDIGTDNAEAHDAYLRGWQFYRRYTPEDFVKAIPHFERAVELDPDFGQAWAALASVYWISYRRSYAWTLIVNPNRDNFVSWLGTHQKAEQYLEHAKRNPTPLAHQIDSQMSSNFRQFDKAISEAERAVELDPNDPEGHLAMAWALIFAGRAEVAIASAENGVRLDPYFPARYLFALGTAELMLGRHREAETTLKRALELSPENMEILAPLTVAYARLDRQEEAIATLQKYTDFWILYAPRIETHMEWWPFRRETDMRRFGEGLVEAGLCCEDRLEAYIGRVRQGGTLE
jgi:TolB-like protein/Flp pilus assembly protein TadD